MEAEIENFLNSGDYSESTQTTYRYHLGKLLKAHPDTAALTAPVLGKWLKSHGWSDSSRYLSYCAIKAFIKWKHGALHPALTHKVKRIEPPPQRTLTETEVDRVYQLFNTTTDPGRRNTAMLSIMLDCGLRASEVCRLDLNHLYLEEGYLEIKVKGNRWETRGFSRDTAFDMDNWLIVRDYYALENINNVFVGLGGRTPGKPLTRDGLRAIVRKWAKDSGLKHFSPHAFRRSAATISSENGASDQMLMRQFGWKHASQPRRYTRKLDASNFSKRYSPVAHIRNGKPDTDS